MDTYEISVMRVKQVLAQGITEMPCYWKGELLRDEHGFVMKRRNEGCCGQGPSTVERYECFHPRIAEGETNCEGRCHFVRPLTSEHILLFAPEGNADGIALPVSDLP